jgi:DNA-binding NarL/FixJ family response regulator
LELQYPWFLYAELQDGVSQTFHLTDAAWGNEAAMSYFLTTVQSGIIPPEPDFREALATARSTSAWNERNRARLRRMYLPAWEMGDIQEESHQLDRLLARKLRARLDPEDRVLLDELATGATYAEVAAKRGVSPGSLRTRVSRLKARLVQWD